MLRFLDKIICALVAAPPLYMVYRFIKWYLRSDALNSVEGNEEELAEENGTSNGMETR